MKSSASKFLEIVIDSINYIIISYALSNMAMILNSNPVFILFIASGIWFMGNYWLILLIVCFAIHIGMVYFIGRIVGDIVPFNQQ